MTMQHTPTPWAVKEHDLTEKAGTNVSDFLEIEGYGLRLFNFSTIRKPDNKCTPAQLAMRNRKRADAAFIVRACNSHDELIKLLEEALDIFEYNDLAVADAKSAIETAIAKAKGQD